MPLTHLSEEEKMFRDQVRQFAEARVRPLVHKMDKEARTIPRALIDECFELGIMGVEIPDELRRRRRPPSSCRSWRSRSWRAWTRRWPCSWTCRTRSSTTRSCAGAAEDQKARYFPKLASKWVGAYALSEAGSGSDAFALACRADGQGRPLAS